MSEWIEKRIRDIAVITMGQSPKSEYYNSEGEGIPFLQGNRTFGAKYPIFDTYTTSPAKVADANDVIMSVRAPVGDLNITPLKMSLGRGVCSLKAKNGNNQFLYYLLSSSIPLILSRSNGTVYDSINRTDIEKMRVLVPEKDETQSRITEILSVYDDAIENNNRRIALLEQAAQELYKEWFMRFRFPEHESIKYEHGLPIGWEQQTISMVANIGRGSSPRPIMDPRYFKNGSIPWIKIADATKSQKYIYETKEFVNEFGASFSRKLPIGTMIIAASGTLGFPMFLGVEGCIHDGWMYFSKIRRISKEYLYFALLSLRQYYNSISYGAAIQNINTDIIRKSMILIPTEKVMNKFTINISIIDEEMINLQKQNKNLSMQRDMLLPRLMNGKLEV